MQTSIGICICRISESLFNDVYILTRSSPRYPSRGFEYPHPDRLELVSRKHSPCLPNSWKAQIGHVKSGDRWSQNELVENCILSVSPTMS